MRKVTGCAAVAVLIACGSGVGPEGMVRGRRHERQRAHHRGRLRARRERQYVQLRLVPVRSHGWPLRRDERLERRVQPGLPVHCWYRLRRPDGARGAALHDRVLTAAPRAARTMCLGRSTVLIAIGALAAAPIAEAQAQTPAPTPTLPQAQPASLPTVVLLATGGTIAMKIDPVKKAPVPAISSEDLLATVPDIAKVARIEVKNPRRARASLAAEGAHPAHAGAPDDERREGDPEAVRQV